ncbi:MAG: CBS domain-containing protein [Fervidicoccaceae archaeon]
MAAVYSDKKPVVLHASTSLLQAVRSMIRRKRYHVVLVDEAGSPWGVLSARDAARAVFVIGEEGIEVAEAGSLGRILQNPSYLYASRPAVTAPESVSLEEALSVMVSRGLGCLPLVDENGRLTGVLDERFLVRAFPEYSTQATCDAATWNPVVVEPDEDVAASVGYMLSMGVRRLVVPAPGGGHKLVSLSQVLDYVSRDEILRRLMRGERSPLEKPVITLAETPWEADCGHTLKEVASMISADPMGAVLVYDRELGKGPGIITERDVLRALARELRSA